MKTPSYDSSAQLARALLVTALMAACAAQAAPIDISNTPLASSASASVLPNLMFVLDDSGSMNADVLPDNLTDNNTCKPRSGGASNCQRGDPPYYAAQSNSSFYNPQISYLPAVRYDGTSLGAQTSPWTSVRVDGFGTTASTINLTNNFPEIRYCLSDGTGCRRNGIDSPNPFDYRIGVPDSGTFGYPNATASSITLALGANVSTAGSTATATIAGHGLTAASRVTVANCTATSGIVSRLRPSSNPTGITVTGTNTFTYTPGTSGAAAGRCDYSITTAARTLQNSFGSNPHYYTITPKEYCSDENLTTCTAATASTGLFTIPAYVRYCKDSTLANAPAPVTGSSSGTLNCQAKYTTTYAFPRYGLFTRTNIVPATLTYGGRSGRVDCAAAPVCSYAEEMTNFANWYAYYRTRMLMMKSAAGRAFLPVDDRYRVGFLTINPNNPVAASKYLAISTFDATQKQAWYAKFYAQTTNGATPLREALSRVGRHYADRQDGINSGMPEDPVQYSCQQNFSILTTDGYWNGNGGQNIAGTAIANEDNVNSGYSTRASGAFDGNIPGASATLADVAMYYYKTDLRPDGSIGALGAEVGTTNNVPTSPKDTAAFQHMTTFTLGIVDGLMRYRSDYETAATGDFASIRNAASGCSWAGGTCNWPAPLQNNLSALDDLWHAAVNGRGTFYQARDPNSVADGLSSALASLNARTAAAAASATSSPNITPAERSVFSSTYTTAEWSGEVVAQLINPATGDVDPAIRWSAQTLLDARVTPTTDTRAIYMFDAAAGIKLKSFTWAGMTPAEQARFSNKCVPTSNLSQCLTLTDPQLTTANNGQNLVNFLRGQTQNEGSVYRDRLHTLGDTVNATPAFMRAPRFAFADAVTPDYGTFKSTINALNSGNGRTATLFIAANDGMLHAFNATVGEPASGSEMWAYVPKMVMPGMFRLAEDSYAARHQYFVDGSPELMDVYLGGAWKTLLVGGLNSGGRGYYALDVTDPANPIGMWEVCSDSTVCAVSDPDLGFSYGNPVITKRDGRWVVLVTSGYNNVSPGSGRGFLFVLDAETGTIREKLATGAGDTTTPSGLGKIAAWADSSNIDNTVRYAYVGDLLGNLWRFDLTVSPATVTLMGTLTDSTGRPQSVTTRPELALVQGNRVVYVGTGRYLGVSDLQDPDTWTPRSTDAYQQSLYAIKDIDATYASGDIRRSGTLVQQTINVVSPTARGVSANEVDWTNRNGWYVDFNPANDSPGERVNIDPQLVLGTLIVVTNVPASNACTIGGDSWLYQFNYASGSFVATAPGNLVAGKLGNAITVGIVMIRLPDGQLKFIATDASGRKSTGGVSTSGTGDSGRRTSWRELIR